MEQYRAIVSCTTGFFQGLNGKYVLDKFHLLPSELTPVNQDTHTRNFALQFDFTDQPSEESTIARLDVMNTAINEAKYFIAWLSTATKTFVELTSESRYQGESFGPIRHYPISSPPEPEQYNAFHLTPDPPEGNYVPESMLKYVGSSTSGLRVPDTIHGLTKKLYSLPSDLREMFFDACFAYQFSLENRRRLPYVSLIALVSCIEGMMRDMKTSGYCADAGRRCNLKFDVTIKFRRFFEENLENPLPEDQKKFLNGIYSNRSSFVHESLLGYNQYRGPLYLSRGITEFKNDISLFDQLVHNGLMNWLKRI